MIKLTYDRDLTNQPRRNPRVRIRVGGEIVARRELGRPKLVITEEEKDTTLARVIYT